MNIKSQKDRRAYILIFFLILGMVGIFGVKFALDQKPKRSADNCLPEVSRQTVILIDHSEVVADQTREEIVSRALSHVLQNVQTDERVTIFNVSASSQSALQPIDSFCRPPADGNRTIENVAMIKKLFLHNFEERLRKALSQPISNSNYSPIAQVITDISLSKYLRGKENTLLVFSDMLEHNDKFSLYSCQNQNSTINTYRASRAGAKERPEFRNTEIILNIIPRMKISRETIQCRDKFWPWFFSDSTGERRKLKIDFLPGG